MVTGVISALTLGFEWILWLLTLYKKKKQSLCNNLHTSWSYTRSSKKDTRSDIRARYVSGSLLSHKCFIHPACIPLPQCTEVLCIEYINECLKTGRLHGCCKLVQVRPSHNPKPCCQKQKLPTALQQRNSPGATHGRAYIWLWRSSAHWGAKWNQPYSVWIATSQIQDG